MGTQVAVECQRHAYLRPSGIAVSVNQYRRNSNNFVNPEPRSTALALELLRVKAELQRRLMLCDEFRGKGFDDPNYTELMIELREAIPTPLLDRLLDRAIL